VSGHLEQVLCFMVQCVKLMLNFFFNLGLFCLTVLFIAKCNLSEMFTRYGNYAGEVVNIIIIARLAVLS